MSCFGSRAIFSLRSCEWDLLMCYFHGDTIFKQLPSWLTTKVLLSKPIKKTQKSGRDIKILARFFIAAYKPVDMLRLASDSYKLCIYQTNAIPATSATYGNTPALLLETPSSCPSIYISSNICLGNCPLS